ncbi:MAG: UvrB/UvrC motif-containing protein [Velocimicrobium sp.]
MLCDFCHKREAKIYYTEIKNGEKKEQYLCEECAAKHSSFQMNNGEFSIEETLGGFLSNILGSMYDENEQQESNDTMPRCESCGITYDEVLEYGKFGCAHCYDSFKEMVDKSLQQIQGSNTHNGKKPEKRKESSTEVRIQLSELEKLAILLQEAIEREEFEEAVTLRDRIRELKGEEECANGMKKKGNTAT